jgi:hypothetical protein
MTGIDASIAQGYLSRMIGDGIITPTNIISKAVNARAVDAKQPSQLNERIQKFIEGEKPTAPSTVEKAAQDVVETEYQEVPE